MKKIYRGIKLLLTAGVFAMAPFQVFAMPEARDSISEIDPGVMYVDPLFEYPVAPESIENFHDKCDWLAENFWNPLDVKNKEAVDQGKLNHAFDVYAKTCQYATKDKVTAGVDKLLKSIQKNPMLLYQITKAAEEKIYGPRAELWIDEMYTRILKSALANKKFPKSKRARYESHLKQLQGSTVGGDPARFDFVRPNGDPAKYFPMSTPTIIIFGDPDCDECRMGKLRMQSNVAFSKAVADGRINVLFIIPDAEAGWQEKVKDFPKNWITGASDSVAEVFDIRAVPEIYVVGSDGKIFSKHIGVGEAMTITMDLIEKKDQK